MKHRIASFFLCAALFCTALFSLTACGSSSKTADSTMSGYNLEDSYSEDFIEMESAAMPRSFSKASREENMSPAEDSVDMAENDLEERKLIRRATLQMETREYDAALTALSRTVASFGGYVQDGEENGSADGYSSRWATYTIRIPADQYTDFLTSMEGIGTVTYRHDNVEDVTMEYTDVESRIRALRTEYETLLNLLEKCENLNDIVSIQSRITEVTYELDSYESRLRRYDNLISYCTVTLTVNEVERISEPVTQKTFGKRIQEGLEDTFSAIATGAENFAVWFITSLPLLVLWALIIVAGILLIRAAVRRCRRKKKERYVPYTPASTVEIKAEKEKDTVRK